MLPVVVCEEEEGLRLQWASLIGDLIRREYPSLRMELLAGTASDLEQMTRTEEGIMLVVLGVSEGKSNSLEGCIRQFGAVMNRNRDNYVLLCVHSMELLDAVLSRCMRPAGILLLPLREELARASLRRILNDYQSLHGQDTGDYLVLSAGGTVQRIAYRDILYFEAQNKLLRVCTKHHAVSVRGSLNALEGTLPANFIRCHRSYIVNKSYVESFSSPDMTICLHSKEVLPVSRSYKSAFRDSFKEGAEAAV